jgi:hypothetical protein
MTLPKDTFAIAGGFVLGLIVQGLLVFFTQGAAWPFSWIANVIVSVFSTGFFVLLQNIDVAKGMLFAAIVRSLFNLIVAYGMGVLGGKLPYRLGH